MITQDTVLTATPIAMEKIPASVRLADSAGPLIQGLCQSTVTLDGYTLENIAVALPKATEGDTEHTVLNETSAESIASVIRQSLGVISSHIVPACDLIERRLKDCFNKNRVVDYIFESFRVNPTIIDPALLNSAVFQVEPDPELAGGMILNFKALKNATWPELTAPEIRNLCKEVMSYPEIAAVFESDEDVISAYEGLIHSPYWLYKDGYESVKISNLDVKVSDLNRLVILNCILYKLDSQDEPMDDVTGITLEDYRHGIRTLKRLTKTLMAQMKTKLGGFITAGLTFAKDELSYKKVDDKYSPFYGMRVLNGNVDISYSEEMGKYFENSDSISLSEVAVGMALAKVGGIIVPGQTIIDRIPGYVELYNKYLQEVTVALMTNIRSYAGERVRDAMIEISKLGSWEEYLNGLEGNSNVTKLENLLGRSGGYMELLTSPEFIANIQEDRKRVLNTVLAVRFADILGVPIASKILANNLDTDCSCQEKQRKALSKAIVQVVLDTLVK